jgi:hypothetical protein
MPTDLKRAYHAVVVAEIAVARQEMSISRLMLIGANTSEAERALRQLERALVAVRRTLVALEAEAVRDRNDSHHRPSPPDDL